MTVQLRAEYQVPTVNRVVRSFRKHVRRPTSEPTEKNMLIELPTGSGKTTTAVEIVRQLAVARDLTLDEPVIWIAPRRTLVEQAVGTCVRQLGLKPRQREQGLRVWVSNPTMDEPQLKAFARSKGKALVHFFTLSRFLAALRRGDRGLTALLRKARLLVWDECHIGAADGAQLAKQVLRLGRAHEHLQVLGLTATRVPACDQMFPESIARYDFHDLLAWGYLAKPLPEPVPTGVAWRPRTNQYGDFTGASLGELARSDARTKAIVERWMQHRSRYGKTLIFACDKAHAKALYTRMHDRGIPVAAMWSGRADNAAELARFRSGAAKVMVNVNMMAEGVDIPDIETVFLCRPTRSRARLIQMIGRGTRLHGDQDTFYLVDFVDSVDGKARPLIPADVLGRTSSSGSKRRWQRPDGTPALDVRSDIDPRCIGADDGLPESLVGLWIHEGQSFGIELELSTEAPFAFEDWFERVFEPLQAELVDVLNGTPGLEHPVVADSDSLDEWSVVMDGSVGLEVVSPKLRGIAGLREVALVCAALSRWVDNRADVTLDARAGVHVHLGWQSSRASLEALIGLWHAWEPALATLVAPSRIACFDPETLCYDRTTPNRFCRPISTELNASTIDALVYSDGTVDDELERYTTLNLANLTPDGKQTVEVRMHSGSTDAVKLITWVALIQGMLWSVVRDSAGAPRVPVQPRTVIEPDGDICARVAETFDWVDARPLQNRLHARRLEVARLWAQDSDLRPWLAHTKAWQDPSSVHAADTTHWRSGPARGWLAHELRTKVAPDTLLGWTRGDAHDVDTAVSHILAALEDGADTLYAADLHALCRAAGARPGTTKAASLRALVDATLRTTDPESTVLSTWLDGAVRKPELIDVCRRANLDVGARDSKGALLRKLSALPPARALQACRVTELRAIARTVGARSSGRRDEVVAGLVFGAHNGWSVAARV